MGTLKQAADRVVAAKTAIGNAITAKGGTVAAGDGLEEFAADIATITNQYTAGDEGKVVSNGALVAQTAYPSTITENGTYNTTENNSVTVNVASINNSGVAYPPGTATGFINVSFVGSYVYVSTRLSEVSSADTTATFPQSFQLSNFIDTDLSFTIEGMRTSNATLHTMTLTLKPATNQIIYKTGSALNARSFFAGSYYYK